MKTRRGQYPKGKLIDMFHRTIATLRGRIDASKHTRVFALLESAEECVIEKADQLEWHHEGMEDYFPFIPVFPESSLSLPERVGMVRDHNGRHPAEANLCSEGLHDFTTPHSLVDPYFLMGVFFWRDPRIATTPEEGKKAILIKNRLGLRTNEMLSLAVQGFHYTIDRTSPSIVICALGSMYSGFKHNLAHEFQTPALYIHREVDTPRLSACIATSAPGPIVYMPFCVERLSLTS